MKVPFLSTRIACDGPLVLQPTSMLPFAATASPDGPHPADEMLPFNSWGLKEMVCSTLPVVLIWLIPPGSLAPPVLSCGIETQNEAPPIVVVSGFHAGCSMPPPLIPPWFAGTWMPTPGVVRRVTPGGTTPVCPPVVWKRFPNAGVSALLAARIKPPFAGE